MLSELYLLLLNGFMNMSGQGNIIAGSKADDSLDQIPSAARYTKLMAATEGAPKRRGADCHPVSPSIVHKPQPTWAIGRYVGGHKLVLSLPPSYSK